MKKHRMSEIMFFIVLIALVAICFAPENKDIADRKELKRKLKGETILFTIDAAKIIFPDEIAFEDE